MTNQKNNNFKSAILPLFVRHIGGLIVAAIFWIGLSGFMTGELIKNLICALVFLIAYSIPSYTFMWGVGHADRNFEKFGHAEKDNLKGLKLGLIVSIPNFVIGLLFVLSKFSLFYNITVIFKVVNVELMPLINLIEQSMYMPDMSYLEIVAILLLTFIPSILCGVFYQFGRNDFRPMRKIMYKSDKESKKSNLPI